MKPDARKAARDAYKQRKTVAGIYAVRCVPSGEIWVSQARNVETMQNQLWFTLRHGSGPRRSLQDAWTAHGGDNFSFEVVDRMADEEDPYLRQAVLKERLAYWCTRLAAALI